MLTIERITKGPWGKILAYFDLRTTDGLVIKGFKLISGDKGHFVGMPSQKNKDGLYFDQVYCDTDVKGDILDLALDSFGGIQQPPADRPGETPPPTGASGQAGDDDIPF